MNARKLAEGEVPVVEQLQLVPDQPLELETGWATLDELAHEDVPEPTKQLLDSIKRFGLLQPILVRATHIEGFDGDGIEHGEYHYDIVDGRRRLSCARILKLDVVPIIIAETDLAIADVATLATNATRTSNPIAEYEAIKRLLLKGASMKDIAGATGMSVGTIKARQGLLRLAPDLVDAWKAGKMSPAVAQDAAKLPRALQEELALNLVEKGRITAADLHDIKLAKTQAALSLPLGLDFADETPSAPNDDDPIEYTLSGELQSIIERLPERYRSYVVDDLGTTLDKLLALVASILMDDGLAIADAKHMRQGDGDPRYKSDTEIAKIDPRDLPTGTFQNAWPADWPPGSAMIPYDYPIQDQGTEGSSAAYAGMRFVDMVTDRKDEDVPVANPEFVYTLDKIEESHAKKEVVAQLKESVKSKRVKVKKEKPVEPEEDSEFLDEVFNED